MKIYICALLLACAALTLVYAGTNTADIQIAP